MLLEQGNKADMRAVIPSAKKDEALKGIRKETTPRELWLSCHRSYSRQGLQAMGEQPLEAPGPGGPSKEEDSSYVLERIPDITQDHHLKFVGSWLPYSGALGRKVSPFSRDGGGGRGLG